MNNDFFDALELLEKEKGIPAEYLLEKISAAIIIAVKRDFGSPETVNIELDPEKRKFKISISKKVVEEVTDPANEIVLEEALKHSKRAKIDTEVKIKLETKQFGRIAAQTAKHVIRQGIREAEREKMLEEFNSQLHDVITATVTRIDPTNGNASVEIDKREMMLFENEQIPNEELMVGDKVKVYVVDVTANEKRCTLKISRTHKDLVKRLFEVEVPEIFEGIVEVKAISREAGARSKMAVWAADENVDAVGACIGPKGSRVEKIVEELCGEKIDIVEYSEEPTEFIKRALAPSSVVDVLIVDEETRQAQVKVPDHQLSLAIGNKGQNAKLAARLTGYKIDIRPESGFFGEETETIEVAEEPKE